MLEHSCNTEITKFNDVGLSQKHILTLYVTMKNFSIVHVLQPQADLSEPVEYETLAKEAAPLLLNHFLEITPVCIVHHDAELALFGLVNLTESDYVGMIQCFENFGFFKRVVSLVFTHFPDVHLLYHSHFLGRLTFHEEGLAECTLS